MISKVDAGGLIPAKLLNSLMSRNVDVTKMLHAAFARDEEIDAAKREALITTLFKKDADCTATTDDENDLVKRVKDMFEGQSNNSSHLNMSFLKSPDPLVKMEVGFRKGEKQAYLKAEAIIDADIHACVAYEWDFMSRERVNARVRGVGLERDVVVKSDHSALTRVTMNLGHGLKVREFLNKAVLKRM